MTSFVTRPPAFSMVWMSPGRDRKSWSGSTLVSMHVMTVNALDGCLPGRGPVPTRSRARRTMSRLLIGESYRKTGVSSQLPGVPPPTSLCSATSPVSRRGRTQGEGELGGGLSAMPSCGLASPASVRGAQLIVPLLGGKYRSGGAAGVGGPAAKRRGWEREMRNEGLPAGGGTS